MLKKKGKFLTIFVIIISSLLLLSGCLGGSSDNGSEEAISQSNIQGQLLDYNEEYAASALVVIKNENGEEVDRQYVEAHWEDNANVQEDTIVGGGFEFNDLTDGQYNLLIHKLGYTTKNVDDIVVRNGETEILDPIVLEPETDFANTTTPNSTTFIDVNFEPEGIDKATLTKALSLAIDNNEITDNIFINSDYKPATRILAPAVAGKDQEILTNYNFGTDYDLNKAEELINNSNVQDLNISFYYYMPDKPKQSYIEYLDYLKNEWNKHPEVTVEFISYTDSDDYTPEKHELVRNGWILDNPDPLFNLIEIANHYEVSQSTENILNKAKLELDNPSEAMKLVYEAEKEMIDNGAFIVQYNYLYQN